MKSKTKRTHDLENLHLDGPAREEAEIWARAKDDEAFQTEVKAIARDFGGVETRAPDDRDSLAVQRRTRRLAKRIPRTTSVTAA